jgi:cardiolipin synthase A/B
LHGAMFPAQESGMEGLPQFAPIEAEVEGHRLTLLTSGANRLAALLGMIDGARESLRLFFYIFSEDDVATQVRDALIAAVGRGVKVTLLVDGFGTPDHGGSFFQPLIASGAAFERFVPRWGRRYLLRNHQKIVVADKARAIIGGSNVSASYYADDPLGKSWHDLSLIIEGPATLRLSRYFDSLARWMKGDTGGFRRLIRLFQRRSEAKGVLRWLYNGPFRRMSPLTHAIRKDLDSATQVDLIQAYFAPNWGMLRKLARVSRRKGRLRIITAAHTDNRTTVAAARHCYRRLLRNGAEIAEYQPQMLHAKLIVADNAVYIGSANFDMRSLYINGEIMLRIENADFAERVRGLVAAHMPWCDPITGQEHRAHSTPFARLRWLVAYFLVSSVDFTITRRLNLRAD